MPTPFTRLASSIALVLALASASRPAAADDPDPWFGKDKALHFGASGVLAGGGYAVGTALWDQRWKAVALGASVAVAAGAAKEGLDAAGLGDPSWRDFSWDLIGAAAGIVIAYAIDWGARGSSPPMTAASSAAIRF